MVSETLIRELQEIMKEECNLNLEFKEASELGNSLVDAFTILLDKDNLVLPVITSKES